MLLKRGFAFYLTKIGTFSLSFTLKLLVNLKLCCYIKLEFSDNKDICSVKHTLFSTKRLITKCFGLVSENDFILINNRPPYFLQYMPLVEIILFCLENDYSPSRNIVGSYWSLCISLIFEYPGYNA